MSREQELVAAFSKVISKVGLMALKDTSMFGRKVKQSDHLDEMAKIAA